MKKLLLVLGVIILLFSACSVLSPAQPTATPAPPPAPTPTPDPCSKENIIAEAEKIQMAVNEFREVTDLANITDVSLVPIPILRLQEIRYEIIKTKVPACLDSFKIASINYSASVINSMFIFLSIEDHNKIQENESEALNSALQNSQAQWQVLLNEFNKVLTIAGVEAQPVTESGNVFPTPTGITITATNEGTSAVNVRAKPDLNADVVTSMGKGTQAEVIGRNEASDWLQVKLNDITGWVSAEMVVVNVPADQLPVVEVIP